jgi:hypothetical protein
MTEFNPPELTKYMSNAELQEAINRAFDMLQKCPSEKGTQKKQRNRKVDAFMARPC